MCYIYYLIYVCVLFFVVILSVFYEILRRTEYGPQNRFHHNKNIIQDILTNFNEIQQ